MVGNGWAARRVEIPLGTKIGLVTVIAAQPKTKGGAYWRVRCECGIERVMSGSQLRSDPPRTHKACQKVAKAE
jgi:hypothetical protein